MTERNEGSGVDRSEEPMRSEAHWTIDKHVPVALLFAIFIQTCGAIWWAATISGRVSALEQQYVLLTPLTAALAEVRATLADVKDDVKEIKSDVRHVTGTIPPRP